MAAAAASSSSDTAYGTADALAGKDSAVSNEAPDFFKIPHVSVQAKYDGPEYQPIWSPRFQSKDRDAVKNTALWTYRSHG